jgi:hypothetical protein
VAGQLAINPETLRNWVHGVGVPLGHRGSDGFASPARNRYGLGKPANDASLTGHSR